MRPVTSAGYRGHRQHRVLSSTFTLCASSSSVSSTTTRFVVTFVPFFSDAWLEEQRGPATEVADFRDSYVNLTNGRQARYFCARLSWNGLHVHQLCDPNDEYGRVTGVVRAAVESLFHDLKRGHFIDSQTRALTLTLLFRANHVGVRSRVTLLFEMTAAGGVLTSYDTWTRVQTASKRAATVLYANLALGLCVFFMLLVTRAGARLSTSR